ncbi:MAG TPA: TatD family hydrolase [Candidatus Cloacimonadota bacterium]|nr:TatD family hydrolase [Candidatus Cloacimonadota bacterium]
MTLIDAHCHLANLADTRDVFELLKDAADSGIDRFVSSALRRREVQWHRDHSDHRIHWHAGIHPNFDECDLSMEDIAGLLASNEIGAVGEIGLDRQNPDLNWQKHVFLDQLRLAQEYNVPVVLHLVGMQSESYTILKQFPLRYLVHGYAGSLEGFNLLCRLDSIFTISSRILRPDKQLLLKAMVEHGRFMFETDITQYYVKAGESNPLLRLSQVFRDTGILTSTSPETMFSTQNDSYNYLFGVR